MPGITYVQRHGTQVFQQPFTAKQVQFYGFVLKADTDRMQTALCDRYLNDPTKGATAFKPAGPLVMLVFNTLNLNSTAPPDSNMGWFPEQEAAIWVPTIDIKRQRLLWFHPYMFVDNSYAMAMGRELYGFPKSLGWFQIPNGPDQADLFTADTLVLPKFSPQTEGSRQRLFQVEKVKEGSGDTPGTFEIFADFIQEMLRLLTIEDHVFEDWRLLYDTADDLMHGRLPMVFLKQFPSVEQPGYACYQTLVEVPSAALTHFHSGALLHGEYELTIKNYDSHPVRDDLGLASEKVRPVLSFWSLFDFQIGNGSVIWSSDRAEPHT